MEEIYVEPQDFLGNAAFARHLIGRYQAIELQHLADYARANAGDEFGHLDVAALLHISDRAAQRRMRFACTLVERLPQTMAALKQGWIEEFKAQLVSDAVEVLSDEHALAVEARVLDKAAQQTPAQLRYALARAVIAVDPEGAEQRRQEKVKERRVESRPTEDGQAMLTIFHSADRIAALHGIITARARELKAMGGEKRTLAQLEADVACDLFLGNRTVEVHLTLPATTIVGENDQPADVDGLPITAQAARELASEASTWRWIRTDPTTGEVVDLTHPRYTPPAALATFIKIRDRTCKFAGCLRRARQCDIDHRTPWPAGATCDTNCACLCRR